MLTFVDLPLWAGLPTLRLFTAAGASL